MAAIQKDPSVLAIMLSPFGLTPGFEGLAQPPINQPGDDKKVGALLASKAKKGKVSAACATPFGAFLQGLSTLLEALAAS